VKLTRLGDLHKLREQCKNAILEKYYDDAIRHTLAGAEDERYPHQFMRVAMWVFLGFFVVSGAIGILAALRLIEVEPGGFGLIWKTFVGSTVALIVGMARKFFGLGKDTE
jgi:hypothetical protein